MKTNKLKELIDATNGRFFSLKFRKLDGSVRVVNGKDFYRRLLTSPDSVNAKSNFSGTAFTPLVDRNKEGWVSASDERLIHFKCGEIEKNF